MKRGTPDHPKTKDLSNHLGIPIPYAIGLLEVLWHYTAKYAIQGNIGKWDNRAIAKALYWPEKKADGLVDALVDSGWLDRDSEHRLLIHDWQDHADQSVRKTLKNHGLDFIHPSKARSVVYFLKAERSGLIKIGTTEDFERRLSSLRAGCPEQLDVLGTVPGSYNLEQSLHRKFHHLRLRSNSEWFRSDEEIEKYISEVLELFRNSPEVFRNDSGTIPPQPEPFLSIASASALPVPHDSPPRPPATDTIASFVDRLYPISMKRKHRTAAEHAVVEAVAGGKIGDDGVSFDLVEQRWKAANATEDWKWKNGAKAQTLAEWITDGNYRYDVDTEAESEPEHHYREMIPIAMLPMTPGMKPPDKPTTMEDLRRAAQAAKEQAG